MKFSFGRSLVKALRVQKKIGKLIGKAVEATRTKPKRTTSTSRPAKPILIETTAFGSNPGRLVMKSFVPTTRLPKNPALVVLLHGCGQTPERLDVAAGFSKLARDRGFVLLYPQQTRRNNSQNCFNWFRPSAVARDRGEVRSIKQMVEHICERHRIDRSRIFVAGLSAGGAMTGALVANYPSLFAGAAIIAGMPFGSARDAMSAMRVMKSGAKPPPGGWGRAIAEISPEAKSWPAITIWQGTEDRVVRPVNALACVAQWLEVQGIAENSGRLENKPWGMLQSWKVTGELKVALYSVSNMGHGLPIKKRKSVTALRSGDPYVIPVEISAPVEMMRVWGLSRFRI
ncbi:PHB depolymerase family esterase [Rhizobium sp. BT-226]|uniref:extracellular catalytic domain type 1 short-chain-length polyhydroxyalkanoate depolymerase n=1 Tax=Rhizobium sp. BT-226 TaxID=2986922 RepID=UPI0021F76AA0|nr:PHB depolymerase family esterase [Rhizobium sp. BT-226]MCW0018949.1 PHB depolymerase family esterase [Rhizobium sp. BT-226]